MKILVTPTSFGPNTKSLAKDELEQFADEIVYNPFGRPLQPDELIPLLQNVDGVIAGLDYFSEQVIDNAPHTLKVISRYGVGVDRVDIQAAARRGIIITNTPGVNSESVADLAIALMLSVARHVPELNSQVKSGGWPRSSGKELYQKTLGVLGLGAIGRAVARRAQGFSMNVLAYDPFLDEAYARANGIKACPFDEVISSSHIITLHLPSNKSTVNCINAGAIVKMMPGAILINTSRGGLIDEEAAYEALVSGKLGGLGLDAFAVEPPIGNPLLKLPNVVATPHIGANTVEATQCMGITAVRNLIEVLTGKPCSNAIGARIA